MLDSHTFMVMWPSYRPAGLALGPAVQERFSTCSVLICGLWGEKSSFLSVVANEGWGQLCVSLSSLPSAVTGTMAISTDHGWGRATGSDRALGRASCPILGWQAGHTYQPTPQCCHLFMPLYTGHEPLCFSSIAHPVFAHNNRLTSTWTFYL